MKKSVEIIIFLSGTVTMSLEIVGSRVLAPYLGNSIIVWSSLIGIILASLSLGYWLGGKLSDQQADYKNFSLLVLIAAILVGIISFSKSIVQPFLQNLFNNIYLEAIFSTIILFMPANIVLGMITPYAIKLRLKNVQYSGRISGSLYAISTVGSIVGTFLAGFFLVAYFSTSEIFYFLAVLLLLASMISDFKHLIIVKIICLILFSYFIKLHLTNQLEDGGRAIEIGTRYQQVKIVTGLDPFTKKPTRYLITDPFGAEAASFLNDDELVFDYLKFFSLANYFQPKPKKSLTIGGGTLSYPRQYLKEHSIVQMDVIEIDPKITELANKYFRLKPDPRITIYHEDGRTFLNRNKNQYDTIFVDAYNSLFPPYQLTTKEAVQKIYNALNDRGVVLVNILSSIDGPTGKFLRAEHRTYQNVFPHVYLFPVQNPQSSEVIQNLILVATKSSNISSSLQSSDPTINKFLNHYWPNNIEQDMPILKDDYAPVDNYLLNLYSALQSFRATKI